MPDYISDHANVGLAIARQHGVTAIGVADTAREVAASHIDFDPAAGAERVVNVA